MPTQMDQVTAADLRRWYDEKEWCPQCSAWQNSQCVTCSPHPECPPLWSRLPDAKPEGLEFYKPSHWFLEIEGAGPQVIKPAVVASLCIMGVADAVPTISFTYLTNGNDVVMILQPPKGPEVHAEASTREEATAIAGHRWMDSRDHLHEEEP